MGWRWIWIWIDLNWQHASSYKQAAEVGTSTTGCTISPILNLPRKQSLFHFPQIACIFRILRHSHGFFLCKPLSFLLPFTSLPFVHQLSNLHGFYVAHHNNVTPYLIPPFSPFSSSSYLHIPLAPPPSFHPVASVFPQSSWVWTLIKLSIQPPQCMYYCLLS